MITSLQLKAPSKLHFEVAALLAVGVFTFRDNTPNLLYQQLMAYLQAK